MCSRKVREETWWTCLVNHLAYKNRRRCVREIMAGRSGNNRFAYVRTYTGPVGVGMGPGSRKLEEQRRRRRPRDRNACTSSGNARTRLVSARLRLNLMQVSQCAKRANATRLTFEFRVPHVARGWHFTRVALRLLTWREGVTKQLVVSRIVRVHCLSFVEQ